MSSIYVEQALLLNLTFQEDGEAFDITGGEVTVDYFFPNNIGDIPNDKISGTIVDGSAGLAKAQIPAGLLDKSGNWRFQPNIKIDSETFRTETISQLVKKRGK